MKPGFFEKRILFAISEILDIYNHYTKNPDDTIITEQDMAIVMIERVKQALVDD